MSFYAFSSCWVGSVEAINPKKRRPDESQLMACLFLRVMTKNALILHFKYTSTFL